MSYNFFSPVTLACSIILFFWHTTEYNSLQIVSNLEGHKRFSCAVVFCQRHSGPALQPYLGRKLQPCQHCYNQGCSHVSLDTALAACHWPLASGPTSSRQWPWKYYWPWSGGLTVTQGPGQAECRLPCPGPLACQGSGLLPSLSSWPPKSESLPCYWRSLQPESSRLIRVRWSVYWNKKCFFNAWSTCWNIRRVSLFVIAPGPGPGGQQTFASRLKRQQTGRRQTAAAHSMLMSVDLPAPGPMTRDARHCARRSESRPAPSRRARNGPRAVWPKKSVNWEMADLNLPKRQIQVGAI